MFQSAHDWKVCHPRLRAWARAHPSERAQKDFSAAERERARLAAQRQGAEKTAWQVLTRARVALEGPAQMEEVKIVALASGASAALPLLWEPMAA